MTYSESAEDIKDLINGYKKDFEQGSLCHNQTGKWLHKQSQWFQYLTGIAALFILGKDTIEWTKIDEKTGGEKILLIVSTVLGIIIEVIAILNRVKEPAKNAELHFQKSDSLVKMKKIIIYKRIKCRNYSDFNELYLEIEEKSAKLPIVRIPDWAIRKVNKQLKEGPTSIQEMREDRRNATLKRSGIKLNKNDKDLYKSLERSNLDTLREIATSSTVRKLDKQNTGIPVALMNHEDLLDYLKCKVGIRTNNLTEKHRNGLLRKVNHKIIENHFIREASKVHGSELYQHHKSQERQITDEQRAKNAVYSESFSRSQAVSDVLSEMLDDDDINYDEPKRLDNVLANNDDDLNSSLGDGPEGCSHQDEETWQNPPPYNTPVISVRDRVRDLECKSESSEHLSFVDINPDISINIKKLREQMAKEEEHDSLIPAGKIDLTQVKKI